MDHPAGSGRTPDPQIPLTAFDELAGMDLTDATAQAALERVVQVALRAVPGATDVSITMLQDDGPQTVASHGELAPALDRRQYELGHGPCLDAASGGELVHISDTRTDTRWPDFAADAARRGVRSSVSAPIPQQGAVGGALNVYAAVEGAIDEAGTAVAESIASYAAVALSAVTRHADVKREAESLRRAMESRAVIEQAKGMIMSSRRCSASEAFAVLVQMSQDTQVKLRDVAAAVVERGSRPD